MGQYEQYLNYFSSKLGRRSFVLERGGGRVMLSAPHSAEQFRLGRPKYAEYITGVIVKLIHDETGCPIIYKTKNCKDDANFDEKSRYKEKLKRYIDKNGIRYLFDIHQMNPTRVQNICVGTGRGANIKEEPAVLKRTLDAFSSRGIDGISVDEPFSAEYPFTVSSFIARECGITCVQLEFNTRLVSKRYAENKISETLASLKELVTEL